MNLLRQLLVKLISLSGYGGIVIFHELMDCFHISGNNSVGCCKMLFVELEHDTFVNVSILEIGEVSCWVRTTFKLDSIL